MKAIISNYSKYNKSTFLMLSDTFKDFLSKKSYSDKKVQYGAIHVSLINESDEYMDIILIKKFISFVRTHINKNGIISYFKDNEFMIFIDNVSSSSNILNSIDYLEKSAIEYFSNYSFGKCFYISLSYSNLPLFPHEIETFYNNIINKHFNFYEVRNIYINKSKLSNAITISDMPVENPTSKREILNDLLNSYIYKDDFFHSLLDVIFVSKDIDCSMESILQLFKKQLDIDSMYLYIVSDDGKHFINRSNFFSDKHVNIGLYSLPSSFILKHLNIYDGYGISIYNNFKNFPFNIRKYLKLKKIQSFCNKIILYNNQILGLIGFESTNKDKIWTQYELSNLSYLSKILSLFIKFNNQSLISYKENHSSINILDNIDSFIFSIDDDYNITYSNNNFRKTTHSVGVRKKCYEVLMNNEYPCSFCPIKDIISKKSTCCREAQIKNTPNESCCREVYYSAIDMYYKLYVTKNENDFKHKYIITGFNIDYCKKYSHKDMENTKFQLFKDTEFTLLEFYNAISSTSDNYIVFFNMKSGNIHISDKLLYELGYSGNSTSFKVSHVKQYICEQDRETFFNTYNNLKNGTIGFCDISFRIYGRNKTAVWVKLKASTSYNIEYKPDIVVAIINLLNKKPVIDYVTNLPNKYHMKYILEENFINKNNALALMLVKVDNLSKISKIFGRNVAELAFIDIIDNIIHLKKSNMMIFSFEWNTLAIKIDTSDINECLKFFRELSDFFVHYSIIIEKNYYASLSAGCVIFPNDASSYHSLINSAEYALEYSIQQGKHDIVFFNQNILDARNRKNKISQIIGDCISKNFKGFSVVYQSHVDTQSEELLGAEALTRFKCDEFGNIPPDEFIPILEEMGFIQTMGKWILVNAVKDCYTIQQYSPNFHINVNISYLQLLEDNFLDFLKETLKTYPIAKGTLYLELTETSIVKNKEDLIRKFKILQGLGIKVAMDDFGVGYSSLGILKEIPLDMLKIDKIFVKGINSNKFDASFIQVISTLCSKANIESCLEGIEEESELNSIKIYSDVTMVQGYYYGIPEPFDKFVKRFNIFDISEEGEQITTSKKQLNKISANKKI